MTELERTLSNFSIATQNMATATGRDNLARYQAELETAMQELIAALNAKFTAKK